MARYATYIRSLTDTQETAHQRAAIDEWLDKRDVDAAAVDHYADLGHSSSDPDREQFHELIDAIETGQYESGVGDLSAGAIGQYLPAVFRDV